MNRSIRVKRLILKGIATARRFRFWLAAGVGLLIFFQIVAFSPKRLEEEGAPEEITTETLRPKYADSFVSPTIPDDRIPDYTVEGFENVSTQAGKKQWRIRADRAFFYQADGIVHAREVHADVYDTEGKITTITSHEAKFFVDSKDLELFGEVKTLFPTGLETLSPYTHYGAADKDITVPPAYPVEGKTVDPDGKPLANTRTNENFDFRSKGLHYTGVNNRVDLLSEVVVHVKKQTPTKGLEITTLESDHATIDRTKNIVTFSMLEARPDALRFVRITQPGMTSKSRRAEFLINANPKSLRTVRALDDVKIEEKTVASATDNSPAPRRRRPEKPRYATSGIAEFDSERNIIILRDYPQVYQDRDTITGETIIVHRDSDLVEVDQSNAFTEGPKDDVPEEDL